MTAQGVCELTEQANDIDIKAIAKNVIKMEGEAVLRLEPRIDESFIKAVEIMSKAKGRIVVTGMGKSGIIGRKISATMASTGSPSISMHPAEALHGDLGMVKPDDVVLALSNSGETEEITKLLPLLKRLDVPVICMVGRPDSTLAKYADIVLDISIEKEACPLGLAPTTSTTVTLVMGDALAICLSKKIGFQEKDFALNHPAGMLGKRLILKVNDIMRTGDLNPIISADTLIRDALVKITKCHAGAATIIDDNGKMIGIFTDGDLRRALDRDENILTKPVQEYMTKEPLYIKPDCLAVEALNIIKKKRIDELPVVDDSFKPLGLLDEGDLLGL